MCPSLPKEQGESPQHVQLPAPAQQTGGLEVRRHGGGHHQAEHPRPEDGPGGAGVRQPHTLDS